MQQGGLARVHPPLELLPAAPRLPHLLRLGLRRDQPPAVRPPGGRGRARRRIPHGVLRHAVRRLLHGRVRQRRRRLGDHGRRSTSAAGRCRASALEPRRRARSRSLVFAAKTPFFVFVFVWVRWTLPRFRYDQLMRHRLEGAPAAGAPQPLLGRRPGALEDRAMTAERFVFDAAAAVAILFGGLMVVTEEPGEERPHPRRDVLRPGGLLRHAALRRSSRRSRSSSTRAPSSSSSSSSSCCSTSARKPPGSQHAVPSRPLFGGLGVVAFALLLLATLRAPGADPRRLRRGALRPRRRRRRSRACSTRTTCCTSRRCRSCCSPPLVGAFVLARREKRP